MVETIKVGETTYQSTGDLSGTNLIISDDQFALIQALTRLMRERTK